MRENIYKSRILSVKKSWKVSAKMVEQNSVLNNADDDAAASQDLSSSQQFVNDDTTLAHDIISANQQARDKPCDQTSEKDESIVVEQEVQKAPDGGWGWFIVVGSCLVHVIMGGFERSNGVMYLQLLSKYGHSATATSWVLSVFSTLRLAMGNFYMSR
ncbi:monocarboxylate transporter 7-like isoform X2 [Mercenaria mercenaria]|uniref:monocarboxylate transporter 7-like isoform X2 n=1 Tax=Mercenaria mercenaria TaxID=6596 RepID=UPI00234F11F7|nr:monocarboxylate transporter 7-like isoform X2 [Mercenaria mercenaria]